MIGVFVLEHIQIIILTLLYSFFNKSSFNLSTKLDYQ